MNGRARLFWRLLVRPLGREPVRMGLTVLAVALGVAVVLAIDLAGTAATGSFRSSLETLTGNYNLEITATGGVPVLTYPSVSEPADVYPARVEDEGSLLLSSGSPRRRASGDAAAARAVRGDAGTSAATRDDEPVDRGAARFDRAVLVSDASDQNRRRTAAAGAAVVARSVSACPSVTAGSPSARAAGCSKMTL